MQAMSLAECVDPVADGNSSCIEIGSRDAVPASALNRDNRAMAPVNPPTWCDKAHNQVWGTRTQACIWSTVTYTTRRTHNGKTTITGQAELTVMQYNYTVTDMGRYAHQIDVSMYKGWGDATKASIDGQGTLQGPCKRESAKFPKQKIAPVNSWHIGESFWDTTATRAGSKGTCTTYWYLTFTNPPYTPGVTSVSMNQVRCDNATAGRPVVGCVIPWFAEELAYSRAKAPTLADHVTKAQKSGLPRTLTRTENQAIIDSNRTKACGNAPSIRGKSCDEYPIATSHQGLHAGGKQRTHQGCGFTGIPSRSGPTGASVCMIAGGDNNYQGGTNTQFFRRWRVLEKDPFTVAVK
ncbi:hypothetical protein [Streptomyces sp. NPDC089799]|uniref:NucA/NucB deoxyribonuclease domain-containing protein n=1 Tax=Streptomyces sp. NPDC089799 TaxID=3155066 RepID=UPI003413F059